MLRTFYNLRVTYFQFLPEIAHSRSFQQRVGAARLDLHLEAVALGRIYIIAHALHFHFEASEAALQSRRRCFIATLGRVVFGAKYLRK